MIQALLADQPAADQRDAGDGDVRRWHSISRKSEVRNPKQSQNSKRNEANQKKIPVGWASFWICLFGSLRIVSDFELRISDFACNDVTASSIPFLAPIFGHDPAEPV